MAQSACYHFFSEFSYKIVRFLLHSTIIKYNINRSENWGKNIQTARYNGTPTVYKWLHMQQKTPQIVDDLRLSSTFNRDFLENFKPGRFYRTRALNRKKIYT